MEVIIRKMRKEDITSVQYVAKMSWYDTYEGIIPRSVQNRFLSEAYSNKRLLWRLRNSFIYVATIDEKIVGYANFFRLKNRGEIELGSIYILPAYQGKGIGSQLLEKGMKRSKELKIVYINVERENGIGHAFYQSKGFQLVDEFDDEFDGHLLRTMRMKLMI
ncbi:N-acetyltransferase family protein [Priestia megaterium]